MINGCSVEFLSLILSVLSVKIIEKVCLGEFLIILWMDPHTSRPFLLS